MEDLLRLRQMSPGMATPEAAAELARRSGGNPFFARLLVHLLAERFKFTQQVGVLKARTGLPASDPQREAIQVARLRALAEESHLDPAFAEKFLNFIVAEVIHHHESLATGTIPVPADPEG